MQLEENELREFATLHQGEFDEPLPLEEARLTAQDFYASTNDLLQPCPGAESSRDGK